jgi:hypothetical protein
MNIKNRLPTIQKGIKIDLRTYEGLHVLPHIDNKQFSLDFIEAPA